MSIPNLRYMKVSPSLFQYNLGREGEVKCGSEMSFNIFMGKIKNEACDGISFLTIPGVALTAVATVQRRSCHPLCQELVFFLV